MESIFFHLFYMEFQLYTCQIGKDLERSYAVYARNLGPPESHTIESAFRRVESDVVFEQSMVLYSLIFLRWSVVY